MEYECEAVFSGLKGRFTSDAVVLSSACEVLQGHEWEAKKKAEVLAQGLGLQNGSLYGNSNSGNINSAIRRPFYVEKNACDFGQSAFIQMGSAYNLIRMGTVLGSHFAGRRFKPLRSLEFLPTFGAGLIAYKERTAYNQGYQATLRDGKVQSIQKTSYFDFKRKYFK